MIDESRTMNKGGGINISVLRFMLAAQMHKPLLKKIFLWKNIFLKSAGKMPISLKVQGKCLYYPSGELKNRFWSPWRRRFTRHARYQCVQKKMSNENESHCFAVFISLSTGICEHITCLKCVDKNTDVLSAGRRRRQRRGSWSERVPSLPSYPSTDRFILK